MATINSAFIKFLENIEPTPEAKDFAQKAHEPIRDHLCSDDAFSEMVLDSFLYGSYKRHTATGDIKDVDIVLLTKFDPKAHTPHEVLSALKDAIGRYYEIPGNEEFQSRSIKINQPLPGKDIEMTLDIVPAIPTGDDNDPILVPDRELQEWIKSHPKGHLVEATRLNSEEISDGTYIPLVKLVKWWWKYQSSERWPDAEKVRPKGFWLECLVSENFDRSQRNYADHFLAVLRSIQSRYEVGVGVPSLADPGIPDQFVSTGLNSVEFDAFLQVVNETITLADKAIQTADNVESSLMWRDVFGDQFPVSDGTSKETQSIIAFEDTSHRQLPAWPERLNCGVKITNCIAKKRHSTFNLSSNGFPIGNGYDLTYFAEVSRISEPYSVYWQVVNTGTHATEERALRGGFDQPKDNTKPLQQTENSLYTGSHSIQCFIVQNGVLVGKSNPFYLNVINTARKRFKIKR